MAFMGFEGSDAASPGAMPTTNPVLPTLRDAKTELQQILQLVSQIDTKTKAIAASAKNLDLGSGGPASGFNSLRRGGTNTGIGASASSMGGAGDVLTGTGGGQQRSGDWDLHAPAGNMGGAGTKPHNSSGGSRSSMGGAGDTAANSGGGGGGGSGRSSMGGAGGTFGAAMAVGAVRGIGGAITSGMQGVVQNDMNYNTLRMGMSGPTSMAGTQRQMIPKGLASSLNGAYASTPDLNNLVGSLTSRGYSYNDITSGGMGQRLGQLGVNTGLTGQSLGNLTGNLTNSNNIMSFMQQGITMGNPATGGDLNAMVNSMMSYMWPGRKPTTEEVNASFKSGNVPNRLTTAGFSADQISAVQRLMLGVAKTGQDANSSKQWSSAAGLNQTLNTSSRARSGAAGQLAASQTQGVDDGLTAANESAKVLSDTFNSLGDTINSVIGAAKGTAYGAGANPLTGSPNSLGSSLVHGGTQVAQDLMIARLLGRGGGLLSKGGGGAASGGGGLLGKIGMGGAAATGGAAAEANVAGAAGIGGAGLGASGLAMGGGALGLGLGGNLLDHYLKSKGHKSLGKAAGIAGDAGAGALIGTMFAPGIGTLIGGGLGALVGAFTGDSSPASRAYSLDPGTDVNGPKDGNTIPQLISMAQGMGTQFRITSAFRPGGGTSYHAKGEAIDVADPHPETDSAGLLGINHYFANKYGSQLAELIYAGPGGINIKDGKTVDGHSFYGGETMAEHHNHVHVALKPGTSISGAALGGASGSTSGTSSAASKWANEVAANLAAVGGGGGPSTGGNNNASAQGASTSTSSGKPPSSMPTGNLSDWEKQALGLLHKDFNTFAPGLTNLIMHESSGNPNAINLTDSNAKAGHPSKGIMQTIDSTFAAYALPGHTNIWNPVDNIIAGFRYAEKNYGDAMIEAGGRKDSKGNYLGYANGAWNLSSDQIAKVHQGEMIVPERIAGAVRSALTQGGIGGGGNTVSISATFMNTSPQEGTRFLTMVKNAMEGNQVMAQVTGS